ncbi:T9SS type A sorting domain-containing protein [Foetidibacter luteolus]|uniref:T9SS type A sorting domain-containing protein n=1 Tax=Foetidibacter luteolus TaxID=2608880 RepID=UPI00129B2B51|nr:T9SS type A sorting domain-containing protein [Foetidibacter luteolus]
MKTALLKIFVIVIGAFSLTAAAKAANINVSGNVWNDINGNAVIDGSEAGTNTGSTLYVNLVDATTSTLVSSVVVVSNGAYSGIVVPLGGDNYKLVLSTSSTSIAAGPLPVSWINTGENIGSNSATQSNTLGQIELPTSFGSASLTAQNFGITPAGYIYIHKKTLDESSSTDFAFSISGGVTAVPSFNLNDNPTQTVLQDIGSSQSGRLWAVGTNNKLYYRDLGSVGWVATAVTNARNVDGGAGNTCYYVTTSGTVVYYNGASGTTIYTGNSATDVGRAWDNQPYVVANSGRICRYTGSGSGGYGSASWPQFNTQASSIFRIDGDPATPGTVIAVNSSGNVFAFQSGTAYTNLGYPGGISGIGLDVAVDESGNIYSSWNKASNLSPLVYKWQSGTTWSAGESTSRNAGITTAGIGGQVWMLMSQSVSPFGNIFSRSMNGSNVWWIDDERVRTSPANGNAEMMAVVPGTYTVTETVPSGWALQNISVYDPSSNSSGNIAGHTATLKVAAGEVVHAIFQNGLVNTFTMTNSCLNSYKEDFGSGASGSYGAALTGQTSYHYMNTSSSSRDGYYKVAGNASVLYSGAVSLNDHTTNAGTGYMMIVDAGYDVNEFFRRRLSGVIPGATYNFSAWIASVASAGINPNVSFLVIDPGNNDTLASTITGNITTAGTLSQYTLSFTATASTFDLVLLNNAIGGNGNDLALDDISFQMIPVPASSLTTSVTYNTGATTCFTTGNLQYTSPVGSSYTYSKDGTVYQSSATFSNLTPGIYTTYVTYAGTTGCATSHKDTVLASVCGNVYNDANGLKDVPAGLVNGIGTNAGGTLNAILFDNTTGNVAAVSAVTSGGVVSVTAFPGHNYSLEITTNTASVGSAVLPAVAMPSGWANVGENLGSAAGNDGTVDGKLSIGPVNASVSNANFGIDQLPSGIDISYVISPVPTRGSTHALTSAYRNMLPLDYNDPEDCSSVCPDSFGVIIKSFGNMNGNVLKYNGVTITPPYTIANYKPDSLTITFNQSGFSSFSFYYVLVDAAGVQSIDPSYDVSWGSAVLAENLLNFTVIKQGAMALLQWSTATGSANDKFTIERSANGSNWQTLTTINGRSNTPVKQYYSYTDNSPSNGNNYYRIQQKTSSGNNSYSKIQLLKFEESWKVSVNPNPVIRGEVMLKSNESIGIIKIMDIAGRIILAKNINDSEGLSNIVHSIDINSLATGVYFIQVAKKNKETRTIKLIKN